MDGDSKTQQSETQVVVDTSTDGRHVLQSVRVRRSIRTCDALDRFLLDYRRHFLWPVGIMFWIILLIFG